MDISDIIIQTVAETLRVPRDHVRPDTKLVDIAKDSITLFELLVSFEKMLGRPINYEDIVDIETIADIIDYVHTLPTEEVEHAVKTIS